MDSEYLDCIKTAMAIGKSYDEARSDWKAVNGIAIDYNAMHSSWQCCEYE